MNIIYYPCIVINLNTHQYHMKRFDQEHLERIINSLSEEQFRRFVKEYLRVYYSTPEVDIIDGPHDGGNDAIVYKKGTQIKISIQITVQENIEKKIIEDIKKAKANVNTYQYIPNLLFFYAKTISGAKKNEYTRTAELDYGISLRIIDKKSLASAVDYYPQLADLLTELLAGVKSKQLRINSKNKIIFDMLTSSGVVNNIKSEFIRTLAQYSIFENGPQPIGNVVSYVNNQLNCNIDSAYFAELVEFYCSGLTIHEDGVCDIDKTQREKIIAIKAETSIAQEKIIKDINNICTKFGITIPSAEKIFQIICAIYNKMSDVEVGNITQGYNVAGSVEKIINNLREQIVDSNPIINASEVVQEIISATVDNEYFAKLSTTQLFTNLFKQDELEEYLSLIPKNIYLDTQILLQIICYLFVNVEYPDFQYQSARTLFKHINNSKCKISLHTSYDYVEEVCVHLWDGFAVSEIEKHIDFSAFGKSNNIFYCFFKYLSESGEKDYKSYNDFIGDLIGIDIYSVNSRQEFINTASAIVAEILAVQDFNIVELEYITPGELDKLTKEYSLIENSSKHKPYRAVLSDIKMVQYLSDVNNHINPETELADEPFFITCDSALYSYRQSYIGRYPKRLYWYIYTPLKFANRLSVMNFKPDSSALTLDLINVAEANFNSSTSNKKSFIDILAMFVGKTNENSWAIAKRIRELSDMNKDNSDNVDFSQLKPTELIESVLTKMVRYYSNPQSTFSLSELIDLIADDIYASQFDSFINDSVLCLDRGERLNFNNLDRILSDRINANHQ